MLHTLHKNEQGPEAVLYKHESRYVYIPYQYDGATVHLLPAVSLDQSPLNTGCPSEGGTKVERARIPITRGSAQCSGHHPAGRSGETIDVPQ